MPTLSAAQRVTVLRDFLKEVKTVLRSDSTKKVAYDAAVILQDDANMDAAISGMDTALDGEAVTLHQGIPNTPVNIRGAMPNWMEAMLLSHIARRRALDEVF